MKLLRPAELESSTTGAFSKGLCSPESNDWRLDTCEWINLSFPGKPNRCSTCGEVFDSSGHLMAHLQHCQGELSSTDTAVPSDAQLAEGTPVQTVVTALRCPNCGVETQDESTLREHVKVSRVLTSAEVVVCGQANGMDF